MKKTKRAFIHAGTGKTGTSSLQSAFVLNREVLQQNHCFYPKDGSQDSLASRLQASSGNARDLRAFMVSKFRQISDQTDADFLHSFEAMLEQVDTNLLLSNESLWGGDEDRWTLISSLLAKYHFETTVVVYVRDPLDFFHSSWAQQVKGSNWAQKVKGNAMVLDFCAFLDTLRGDEMVPLVRLAESPIRTELRYYYPGLDVVSDFFESILGIKLHSVEAFTVNPSLTPADSETALEINRWYMSGGISARERMEVVKLLLQNRSGSNEKIRVPAHVLNRFRGLFEECVATINRIGFAGTETVHLWSKKFEAT